MSTMADAEDSLLRAQSTFLEFLEAFQQQWDAPLTDTLSGAMWAGIDDPTKEQLRGMVPGAVDKMDQSFGRRMSNGKSILQPNQQPGAFPAIEPGQLPWRPTFQAGGPLETQRPPGEV